MRKIILLAVLVLTAACTPPYPLAIQPRGVPDPEDEAPAEIEAQYVPKRGDIIDWEPPWAVSKRKPIAIPEMCGVIPEDKICVIDVLADGDNIVAVGVYWNGRRAAALLEGEHTPATREFIEKFKRQ